MAGCAAFVAEGRSGKAWRPCKKRAGKRTVFCLQHAQVLAGVMLGVCMRKLPDRRLEENVDELRTLAQRVRQLNEMPVSGRKPH
ncbi:MAG TPA: hypothetical protein VMT51_16250 [Dongiaceae bacterium]|nr:hypothetical protein [Dongiaceae bacterium]